MVESSALLKRRTVKGTEGSNPSLTNLTIYISKIASISTAAPSGKEETPTAARECLPAFPMSATIRSEAPLMILG